MWKVSHEKLRNDTVDVNFVAFATYFDGPLTNDKRAADIYARAERSATGSLRHPAIVVIGERDRVGAETFIKPILRSLIANWTLLLEPIPPANGLMMITP